MAVIGIDFGTEFSTVTVENEVGQFEAIPDDQGKIRVSSCVSFHEDGIRVGNLAELKREFNVKNTIYDIKMLIGISFGKGTILKSKYGWPFELIQDSEGRMQVQVHYLESVHKFYPEEIVSIFFRHLIEIAEKRLQRQKVRAAVISVSNSFNHSQRKAIIDSADIAHLQVEALLNDTTAAAVYYAYMHQNHKEKITETPTSPSPTSPTPTSPTPTSPTPTSPTATSPTPTSPSPTSPTPTSPTLTSPTPTSPISTSPTPTSPTPTSPTPTSPTPTSPTPTSPTLTSPISTSPTPTSPISTSPTPTSPTPTSPSPTSPSPTSPTPTSPTPTSPSPTSPTLTSPTLTSPTPTSPISTSPTPTSPTQTSPTSTSPISTSPTQTSPTQTSPTQTSPISTSPTPTSPISTSPTPTSPISTSPTPTSPTPTAPTPTSTIPTSPTSTSPTPTSPTPTSPISTTPTPTSPTQTSPTPTSPTRTSPIPTSPTPTSPTQTSPIPTSQQPCTGQDTRKGASEQEGFIGNTEEKTTETPTPALPTPTSPTPTSQPCEVQDTQEGTKKQNGCTGNTENKSQLRSGDEQILFINIGAGTFSVGICSINNDSDIEVVRSDGVSSLGGRDINRSMYDRLTRNYCDNVGLNRSLNQVKKEFSSSERHTAIGISSTDGKTEHQEYISRDTFEDACIPLKSSLESTLKNTLFCQFNGKYEITKVLLAGGSTRLPLMNKLLERFDLIGKVEKTYVKTDEIVALGVCIMANKLSKKRKVEAMIREKLSYGIHDDGKETLVAREATLPVTFEKRITGETFEILDEDGTRMLMVKKRPESSLSSYSLRIDGSGLLSVLPKEIQTVADGLPKDKIEELKNKQSGLRKSNVLRKRTEDERYRFEKMVLHIKKRCAAIEMWIEDNPNSTRSDCQRRMQEFVGVLQDAKENLESTLNNQYEVASREQPDLERQIAVPDDRRKELEEKDSELQKYVPSLQLQNTNGKQEGVTHNSLEEGKKKPTDNGGEEAMEIAEKKPQVTCFTKDQSAAHPDSPNAARRQNPREGLWKSCSIL